MEFQLNKLTKYEWESIEVKCNSLEKNILSMILNGYKEHSSKFYVKKTFQDVFKFEHKEADYYVYQEIFKKYVDKMTKTYDLSIYEVKKIKGHIQKKDLIRLNNAASKQNTEDIIEWILLSELKNFLKKKNYIYYYNIYYLIKYYKINIHIKEFIEQSLSIFKENVDLLDILKKSKEFIQDNPVFDYTPYGLKEHQKDMYCLLEKKEPKLILYRAPTSSGKTLTPIGITQGYKVIFVCASKHIGLSLAKSCVNVNVNVAFSFGCNSIEDIRLHYSSVTHYIKVKNRKKPNHMEGSKVEIMISDLYSYEHACNYMFRYNKKEDIVLFWDEPTISMDYDTHPLHNLISSIWEKNQIPTIVLCSATLPNYIDLSPLCEKYKAKYQGNTYYIDSIDDPTNITLIHTKGDIIIPHRLFQNDHKKLIYFLENHIIKLHHAYYICTINGLKMY